MSTIRIRCVQCHCQFGLFPCNKVIVKLKYALYSTSIMHSKIVTLP